MLTTDKQRTFAREYLTAGNPTQAAINAGYSDRSEAAHVRANKLLKNPDVRALIAANLLQHVRKVYLG